MFIRGAMDENTQMPKVAVPDLRTIVTVILSLITFGTMELLIFSLGPTFFVCMGQDPSQPLKCIVYELSDGQVLMVPEVIKSLTDIGLVVKSGDPLAVIARFPFTNEQSLNIVRALLGVGGGLVSGFRMWMVSKASPVKPTSKKTAKSTRINHEDANFPDQFQDLIKRNNITYDEILGIAKISKTTLVCFLKKERDAHGKTLQSLRTTYDLLCEKYEPTK